MATRAAFSPLDAEFASANAPQLTTIHTTARRPVLGFDATADETAYFTGVAPQGLTGAMTAVLTVAFASATSGAARWQVALEAVTAGDATDLDAAESYDTDNSAGVSAPATAGYIVQVSVTLTNADSIAAGDLFRLRVRRDADGTSGTDDATGDAYLLAVELRDAA